MNCETLENTGTTKGQLEYPVFLWGMKGGGWSSHSWLRLEYPVFFQGMKGERPGLRFPVLLEHPVILRGMKGQSVIIEKRREAR